MAHLWLSLYPAFGTIDYSQVYTVYCSKDLIVKKPLKMITRLCSRANNFCLRVLYLHGSWLFHQLTCLSRKSSGETNFVSLAQFHQEPEPVHRAQPLQKTLINSLCTSCFAQNKDRYLKTWIFFQCEVFFLWMVCIHTLKTYSAEIVWAYMISDLKIFN